MASSDVSQRSRPSASRSILILGTALSSSHSSCARRSKCRKRASARLTVAPASGRWIAVSPSPTVRDVKSRCPLYSLMRLAVISASGVSFPK